MPLNQETNLRALLVALGADVKALQNGKVPFNQYVEGVNLFSYGHSFTMYPNPYTTTYSGEYPERVRTRLHMGDGFFRGRSGTGLADTVSMMLSPTWGGALTLPAVTNRFGAANGSRVWAPNNKGIVLLQNYMNEAGGTTTAQFRAMWKNQLRTALAIFGSKSIVSMAGATLVGTWTRYGGALSGSYEHGDRYYNDDVRFATLSTATASFPVTGDECWFLGIGADPSYSVPQQELKVGSTVLRTITPTGEGASTTSAVVPAMAAVLHLPTAYKVTGMNAAGGGSGAKNLVVRSLTNGNSFANAVLLPSATPPHVFVAKEPTRNIAAAGGPEFVINKPYFDQIIDDVCAEFPYAHVVDLLPGWDVATMVGSLDAANFHPGDYGQMHIANRFIAAINAAITGPINGVQVN